MIKRREFLVRTAFISAGMHLFLNGCSFGRRLGKRHQRLLASVVSSDVKPYPSAKRVPLGWKVMPVPKAIQEKPTLLSFQKLNANSVYAPVVLRITAAIDFRDEKQIRAYLPETGVTIGMFIIKYAHPFQPFELAIDRNYLKDIAKEGLALELTQGTDDAWFYAPDPSVKDNLGLQPHLLIGECEDVEQSFFQNLYSMNAFSPFGWMGGSVQDALYELHLAGDGAATKTLKRHLDHYLDEEKGVVFENPHTMPMDGSFNSIEDLLPFACIVPLFPNHVAVEHALNYLLRLKNGQGLIMHGQHVTTEGCYTVAYPLAAMAEARADAGLAQVALDQLSHRISLLSDEEAIYQRAEPEGPKGFRNWGRAVVWYLLGIVKTLRIIERNDFGELEGMEEIKRSFRQGAALSVRYRDEQGMWHAYIDHHEYGVDTSATAGIAASIAWGVQQGWLDADYLPIAREAYQGLLAYVAPDGFLRNVSQINRGGETLQKSQYRVVSQFGMGLMAQLKAALRHLA